MHNHYDASCTSYLEDADGEDGPVVHLPDDLGDCVVAAAPDEHRAVAVAGDHVAVAGEGEAGHVLGLVALVEDPRLAGQREAGRVQRPEVNEALANQMLVSCVIMVTNKRPYCGY